MKSRRAKPPAGTSYRVGELSKLSGVSVQTIRFYVTQGLLPAPVKTARNMGWYSDVHVRLLRLVQKLQHERFLSLKTIRTLVQANEGLEFTGDDEERLEQLRARLESSPARPAADTRPAGSADLARLTEREQSVLRSLDRSPERKGGEVDASLLRLWVAIRDSVGAVGSVSPELLRHISDLADRAVSHELEILGERFRAMSPEEGEKILDVVIPGLNQLFALLHQRSVGRYFGSQAKAADRQIQQEENPG
ncbi:MAG: MerR family transcriptional regulator [Panacagrimonas sp.]